MKTQIEKRLKELEKARRWELSYMALNPGKMNGFIFVHPKVSQPFQMKDGDKVNVVDLEHYDKLITSLRLATEALAYYESKNIDCDRPNTAFDALEAIAKEIGAEK